MPTDNKHNRQLQIRVQELEAENRRLRERAAWAVMVMRDCVDRARRSLGDLEGDLLVPTVADHIA